MQDFLKPQLDDGALRQLSPLALAHIGDGVYELMSRGRLVTSGMKTARAMHQNTVRLVRAPAQCDAARLLLPLLTMEEQAVFRHGRNAHIKAVPKSSTRAEYAYATALETLFGWLFLRGEYDRLNELYNTIAEAQAIS